MTVSLLCIFLTVPWVGLHCVIVAFPGHTNCKLGIFRENFIFAKAFKDVFATLKIRD